MASRRRVIFDDVPPSNKMRREIERVAATNPGEIEILRKDFHLIEAAIATDRTVVSLDEAVKRLFRTAALSSVTAIEKIVWVNPTNTAEDSVAWLQKGAKPENTRMLRHNAHES